VVGRDEAAAGDAAERGEHMIVRVAGIDLAVVQQDDGPIEPRRASAPSSASVAEPEKLIVSPTRHAVDASGALIVGTGAVLALGPVLNRCDVGTVSNVPPGFCHSNCATAPPVFSKYSIRTS
jgi:hypothetical protein